MWEDFWELEFIWQYIIVYLSWIVVEIEKYDFGWYLYVNSYMFFVILLEYEFLAWWKLFFFFGVFMYLSWYFGYFECDQYLVVMGVNNDIVWAGVGEKFFWVIEL